MKNDVQTKTDVQMTEQEVSEKFNRGRKVIDFVGSKKIFFGVSLGIMLIGIICNFIFGTTLDIQFSGGATLTFSYTSDEEHPIDQNALYDFIQEKTTDKITTSFSEDLMGNTGKNVSVQFSGNDSIETDIQKNLEKDLQAQYPDNNFITLEANSVDASMGFSFLLKCLHGSGSSVPRRSDDLLPLRYLPDAYRLKLHRGCTHDSRLLTERYHRYLRPCP